MADIFWINLILTFLTAIYFLFYTKQIASLRPLYANWLFIFGIVIYGGLFHCIIEKGMYWAWFWGITLAISIIASTAFAIGFFLRKHLLMAYSFFGFMIYWALILYLNTRFMYNILKTAPSDLLFRFIYPLILWIIIALGLIVESVYIGNRILKLAKIRDISPEYQESRLCPSCNKTVSKDARFCNYCGKPIADG